MLVNILGEEAHTRNDGRGVAESSSAIGSLKPSNDRRREANNPPTLDLLPPSAAGEVRFNNNTAEETLERTADEVDRISPVGDPMVMFSDPCCCCCFSSLPPL